MNEANSSPTTCPPISYTHADRLITRRIAEDNRALINIREEADKLFTGRDQVTNDRVKAYLELTEGPDAMLLNAWRRCGQKDRARTIKINLSSVARTTMSPLGIACLIAYSRAWLDEAEARAAASTPKK